MKLSLIPGVLPTVRSGDYVWIEVSFAYRGEPTDMPWPVRTGAMVQLQSSAECPVDADWILDSAAQPSEDAPPEMSSTGKAWEVISNTADDVGTGALKLLWPPLAVVGASLLLLIFARSA